LAHLRYNDFPRAKDGLRLFLSLDVTKEIDTGISKTDSYVGDYFVAVVREAQSSECTAAVVDFTLPLINLS